MESTLKWIPLTSSGNAGDITRRTSYALVKHVFPPPSREHDSCITSAQRTVEPLFCLATLLSDLARETLDAALAEYNAINPVMDLVLFDEVSVVFVTDQRI